MDKYKNGSRMPVIDAKGRKRGMKQWVVCPVCEIGRWVRDDSLRQHCFSSMCKNCHNKYHPQKRENHGRWKGGMTEKKGYIARKVWPDHPQYPMATRGGYILEHRLVMAQSIGRCLDTHEIVHHKNGDTKDNRIENLELFSSITKHLPSIRIQTIRKFKQRIKYLESKLKEHSIHF